MTQAEFKKAVKDAVGKVAYIIFSTKQTPPYAVFGLPNSDDTFADNEHYHGFPQGWVELYMSGVDFELMKRVERVFIDNSLPWSKENEAYLDNEKLFYARWEFQLI